MTTAAAQPDTVAQPIVVGTDGSPQSVIALRTAGELAAALERPLKVITTWDFPSTGLGYYPAGWSPSDDAEETARKSIDEAFRGESFDNLKGEVVQGSPAAILIEESRHAFMLVVGSRGHGGFAGLLLGSVSSAVAEHAHCPVLVVH